MQHLEPEPIEWNTQPVSFWKRLGRAASVPALAGGVVFVVAVLVAIVTVWLQPHTPSATADSGDQALLAEGAGDSGAAGAKFAQSQTGATDSDSGEASATTPDEHQGTAKVFVHVVGEVEAPGVIELAAGSRVAAAIEAAGGASAKAELSGVNLARVLVDGEQVVVPDAKGAKAALAGSGTGAAGDGGSGGAANGTAGNGLVNLNTADQAALETLPRVGPALAARILDWRAQNGRFASVDQLLEVSGIGQKTLDGFREQVII